jgi:tetratricopeptide (TPR) repeat protein
VNSPRKHVTARILFCAAAIIVWNQPILAGVRVLDQSTTGNPPVPARGATYSESLATGDRARRYRQLDQALAYYETAIDQAANDTERALAIGKKAEIYAFERKDYEAARAIIEGALRLNDVQPVARVTALQVLAECRMKADTNYQAAVVILEQAAQLRGVEWAQPSVAIKLGDCYRFTGRYDEALAAYQRILGMSSADRNIKAVTYLNIGLTYQYDLGDAEKAKAAYAKAAEMKPDLKNEIDGHLAKIQ